MANRLGAMGLRRQFMYGDVSKYIGRSRVTKSFPPYARQFTKTASSQLPRKDSQDRESINTEATEYTKSGTDDQAARQEDAAFDPSKTSPEEQKNEAGEGNEVNPLEVSPANPEVSKQRPKQEGGAEKAADKGSSAPRSGSGSPNKSGKIGA